MSWSKVMLEASVAPFAHQCTSPFSTGRFVVNGQYLGFLLVAVAAKLFQIFPSTSIF